MALNKRRDAEIKKREFYHHLAEKYDLPYEYIRFKMNPHYLFESSVELSLEYLKLLEDAMNWQSVKEDFERDRNRKASVFYGM